MSEDLENILGEWEYSPTDDARNVRRVKGKNGRDRIQVRTHCGLLEWYATGRPDGKRPYDKESILEQFATLLDKHIQEDGSDENFQLDIWQTEEIHQEIVDYYHRRAAFFLLGEYENAIRDGEHNRALMDLLRDYSVDDEAVEHHEQFRSFLIVDLTRSEALMHVQERRFQRAMDTISAGIEEIKRLYEEEEYEELAEEGSEIKTLENLREELRKKHRIPLSKSEVVKHLEDKIRRAVNSEDYESAANLRDELFKIQKSPRARRK